MTLQQLITHAISDGINMKLLYLASGESWDSFGQKHRDDLFSAEQETQIRKTIREWEKGNKEVKN